MHVPSGALRIPALLTLLLAVMCGPPAGAAEANDVAVWAAKAEQRLQELESASTAWESTPPDEESLLKAQEDAAEIGTRADSCVASFTNQLTGVQEKLTALGEPDDKAAADIRELRKQLEAEQQAIDRQLAKCRLLSLGTRDLKETFAQLRREMLSKELLNRNRHIWDTFKDAVVNGLDLRQLRQLSFEPWPALGIGIMLLAVLMPVSLAGVRALRKRHPLPAADEASAPQRRTILLRMYQRRTPWLVALTAVSATLYSGGMAPLAAILAALLVSMAFAPLLQLLICEGRMRCAAGRPARLLMDILLVAGALMLIDAQHYLSENAFLLLRGLFFLLLAVTALWLLRRLTEHDDLVTLRSLTLPISVALLAGPVADWIGYHNLGAALTLGVYGTAAGILIVWLLLSSINHFLDALGDSENENPPPLRQWLGYSQGEKVRGIGSMRWLLNIGALIGLVYWLSFAWQVSDSDKAIVRDWINQGFDVGAVRVVPVKLIGAIVAFVVLLTIARWLKRQLDERWLTKTSLDSGARQSIVSLSSYTIIGLAIMLALSMAGLDFQNLAIVAGALSVGIGFGLQNIVNNFVSGLILLFERPVRPGDWVVVGGTEGYVRKISIRYTLIQTFDRADVLVPNSELISNQVTNLMLTDTFGRVTAAVGVAYGSDTRKVRDILHRVAKEHPMAVLHDPRVSPPRVFFMGFGDSSLDFELRFFIQNIDYKLSVRSDVLFAIDDAFREAGIEIPFPQRVVYMHQQTPATPPDAAGDPPR
jgi:small-conductance mechanosensitive channel